MKKNTFIVVVILIVATAIFSVVLGFSPHIAVAVFSGALFASNKKLAFMLPILTMLLSDVVFQVLYLTGKNTYPGFYGIDQLINYLMIAGLAFIGLYARGFKLTNILAANVAAPVVFFLVSNFFVWATFGGWHHPLTFSGLMACYVDGIPFFWKYLGSTLVFGTIFFGAAILSKKLQPIKVK